MNPTYLDKYAIRRIINRLLTSQFAYSYPKSHLNQFVLSQQCTKDANHINKADAH
jgi:hypothetical protein